MRIRDKNNFKKSRIRRKINRNPGSLPCASLSVKRKYAMMKNAQLGLDRKIEPRGTGEVP